VKSAYVLGSTQAEHRRLMRQARLISNLTRHLLEDLPLRRGIRILDVGAGAGDVALTLAKITGPRGQVVCVDSDAAALEIARLRSRAEGLTNMCFHHSRIERYESTGKFDLVFGRCVLIHQSDPAGALLSVTKHARSGGIIAFQEPWFSRGFSHPRVPLFEQVISWIHSTVAEGNHVDMDFAVRLPSLFRSAGLPAPKLMFEMVMDSQHDPEIYRFVADTAGTLLPRMEELGIALAEAVQPDTLADHLQAEAIALNAVIGVMPMIGAWCKKP
jgi:SAM-dependent methyltransferase